MQKESSFIGAHPDDIELGCGALIANISASKDIICVTLSDNQKNPLLRNVVAEHYESMAVLGVEKQNVIFGSFETRRFAHQRQEILEFLITIEIKRPIPMWSSCIHKLTFTRIITSLPRKHCALSAVPRFSVMMSSAAARDFSLLSWLKLPK